MTTVPRKIAFVSGKGGVGKTLLAANFAFCSSTIQRTLLIDFDFQNQGMSGLLAQYLRSDSLNAFDLLTDKGAQAKIPVEVRPNLFFAPAFDPHKTDRFASQLTSAFHAIGVQSINQILEGLLASGNYQLVVVDCHGGLDDVSFAAFISSDTTFIVTEADKVTFNGTLELLDFYVDRAAALAEKGKIAEQSSEAVAVTASPRDSVDNKIFHIEDNKVRFLVNRVSGKFSYETLSKLLERQFYTNVRGLREMCEGFSFIPADPLAGESFSEYPFYLELMPESVFAQKLELIFQTLFGRLPVVSGRSRFFKLFERIKPSKLQRYLRSPFEVRVQAVFSFVAASQLLFLVFSVLMIAVAATQKSEAQVLLLLVTLLTLFFLYLAKFNTQVGGFYRDRMRYEIRLYQRGARALSVVLTVRIVRILLFRFVLLLGAVMYLTVGLIYGGMILYMLITGDKPASIF